MHFSAAFIAAAAAYFASTAIAHPGGDHTAEVAARKAFFQQGAKRDLSHCSAQLKARGVEDRLIQRRSKIVREERSKRSLKKRSSDLDTVVNTNHLSSDHYTRLTSEETIFSSNASTILQPEVTQGPFYADGEYIRRNIIEDQPGIPLILDIQIVDVNTCEPVVNSYIDLWHANSTGVYSGVVSNINGNVDDTSNVNKTFLRGLQPTEYDGVAQFTTIFPGHYSSRATHIHILTHMGGSILDNDTYTGGTITHVGQLFFDQDLITQVTAQTPYSTNSGSILANADDTVLQAETTDTTADPFPQYNLLGDDICDGIFAWISVGVDASNAETVSAASTLTANGGEQSDSGMGGGQGFNGTGGMGGPGFNGTRGDMGGPGFNGTGGGPGGNFTGGPGGAGGFAQGGVAPSGNA